MTRTAKLLAAVKAAGPAGIAPRDLVSVVYDEPDGGPLTAPACIHVMAHILRKRKLIKSTGESWTTRYYATRRAA